VRRPQAAAPRRAAAHLVAGPARGTGCASTLCCHTAHPSKKPGMQAQACMCQLSQRLSPPALTEPPLQCPATCLACRPDGTCEACAPGDSALAAGHAYITPAGFQRQPASLCHSQAAKAVQAGRHNHSAAGTCLSALHSAWLSPSLSERHPAPPNMCRCHLGEGQVCAVHRPTV
jgi:hypothetical protein